MATPRPATPLGVGAGGVICIDLSVCKVEVLPLKMGLAGCAILWWKALQNDVLELAVRGVLLKGDGIEAVAAPVLLVNKLMGVFIRPYLYRFHF